MLLGWQLPELQLLGLGLVLLEQALELLELEPGLGFLGLELLELRLHLEQGHLGLLGAGGLFILFFFVAVSSVSASPSAGSEF